jgi:hypothetical protein
MRQDGHKNPIDRMSHADSVMALLGRVNVNNFPGEERIAIATVQVEALDEWLAADLENSAARPPLRSDPDPGSAP